MLASVMLVGPGPFLAWIEVLRSPDYLSSPMAGNMALGSLPLSWSALMTVAAIGLAIVALRRGPWPALGAAVCLGLLVSPYTLAYAAEVLLVVVPALAARSPLVAASFAVTASAGVIVGFPFWVASALCLCVLLPSSSWPFSPPAWAPEDPS
jgi:hypothetical protein